MKKLLIIAATAMSLCSCSVLSSVNWNAEGLANAAGKVMTAASINDEQIAALSRQTIVSLDQQNVIDNGAYAKRLARVMSGINEIDGIPINYKVYKTSDINAFACGDGSIRVYSGLMDVMDDEELTAIIGHESATYAIRTQSVRSRTPTSLPQPVMWWHPPATTALWLPTCSATWARP